MTNQKDILRELSQRNLSLKELNKYVKSSELKKLDYHERMKVYDMIAETHRNILEDVVKNTEMQQFLLGKANAIQYKPNPKSAILCVSDESSAILSDSRRYYIRKNGSVQPNDWVFISRNYKNYLIPTDIQKQPHMFGVPIVNDIDPKDICPFRLSRKEPDPPYISHYSNYVYCYTDLNVLIKRKNIFLRNNLYSQFISDSKIIFALYQTEYEITEEIKKRMSTIHKLLEMVEGGTIFERKVAFKKATDLITDTFKQLNL